MIGAAERARNLFSVLDSDGNGVLTLEEFIAGILSCKKIHITNIFKVLAITALIVYEG